MKILIVHPALPPVEGAEGICTEKLIDALASHGSEVEVITGAQSVPIPGVRYHQIGGLVEKPEGYVEKLIRLANLYPEIGWKWAKLASRYIKSRVMSGSIDVVYTRSMPFVSHLAAFFAALPKNVLWVSHFSDPWPPVGYYGRARNNWRLMWHRRIVQATNAASFPCNRVAEFCESEQWGSGKPATLPQIIIPHIMPKVCPEAVQVPRSDNKIVFLHCGGFYGGRQPDNLLKAWAKLMAKYPALRCKVELQHIGPISDRFEEIVSSERISDCATQLGSCSYPESLVAMRQASFLILVESVDMNVSIYLPSKLMDYLWASKAIIALTPREGTVSDILGPSYDLRASPDDVDGIERVLTRAFSLLERSEDKLYELLKMKRQLFTPQAVAKNFLYDLKELRYLSKLDKQSSTTY